MIGAALDDEVAGSGTASLQQRASSKRRKRNENTIPIVDRPSIVTSALSVGARAPAPPAESNEHVVLVHGPSQSGRTSLLMDLAIRLAAMTPCRCYWNNDNDIDISGKCDDDDVMLENTVGRVDDEGDDSRNPCCTCTAVLFFRVSNDSLSTDRFPLPCHNRSRIQNKDGSRHNSNIGNSSGHDFDNASLLNRIKVYHVADVRDIFMTLLTVQGWKKSEQPWGGILIDDIDQFVGIPIQPPTHAAANTTVRSSFAGHSPPHASYNDKNRSDLLLSKLMAVLVDTAQFLQKQHHHASPAAVTIAATSTDLLPPKTTNFCCPCVLRIKPSSSSSTNQQQQQDSFIDPLRYPISNEVIESHWRIERYITHRSGYQSNSNMANSAAFASSFRASAEYVDNHDDKNRSLVLYDIVRSTGGVGSVSPRIYWRRLDENKPTGAENS